jgi:hypothetical protein
MASFEQLLRRNMLPNLDDDLDILANNNEIENDPNTFLESKAGQRGIDVNNLLCVEVLIQLLTRDVIGFSIEAARILAPEMFRRRIIFMSRQ